MATIIQINPGYERNWAEDKFSVSLPLESRIEIHNVNDPNFPYEVRVISIKELSEQDAKTRNLFVTVTLENHTKNRSFEVFLCGRIIYLRARSDGRVVRETVEVKPDDAEMSVNKIKGYTHQEEVALGLAESNGFWTTSKILLRELGSYLLDLVARIFRFCTSFFYRQQPQN